MDTNPYTVNPSQTICGLSFRTLIGKTETITPVRLSSCILESTQQGWAVPNLLHYFAEYSRNANTHWAADMLYADPVYGDEASIYPTRITTQKQAFFLETCGLFVKIYNLVPNVLRLPCNGEARAIYITDALYGATFCRGSDRLPIAPTPESDQYYNTQVGLAVYLLTLFATTTENPRRLSVPEFPIHTLGQPSMCTPGDIPSCYQILAEQALQLPVRPCFTVRGTLHVKMCNMTSASASKTLESNIHSLIKYSPGRAMPPYSQTLQLPYLYTKTPIPITTYNIIAAVWGCVQGLLDATTSDLHIYDTSAGLRCISRPELGGWYNVRRGNKNPDEPDHYISICGTRSSTRQGIISYREIKITMIHEISHVCGTTDTGTANIADASVYGQDACAALADHISDNINANYNVVADCFSFAYAKINNMALPRTSTISATTPQYLTQQYLTLNRSDHMIASFPITMTFAASYSTSTGITIDGSIAGEPSEPLYVNRDIYAYHGVLLVQSLSFVGPSPIQCIMTTSMRTNPNYVIFDNSHPILFHIMVSEHCNTYNLTPGDYSVSISHRVKLYPAGVPLGMLTHLLSADFHADLLAVANFSIPSTDEYSISASALSMFVDDAL